MQLLAIAAFALLAATEAAQPPHPALAGAMLITGFGGVSLAILLGPASFRA